MQTPTTPRLILFTIAVLAGAVAVLTDFFFLPGIFLIGFSGMILMNQREQSKEWSRPLTKGQIVRGFIPLILMFTFVAGFIWAREQNITLSETTSTAISNIFKVVFVMAAVFMVGRPWLLWYRNRTSAKSHRESD